MRKIIILSVLTISIITTYAQNTSFFDYTESFDYVFRNISRADATTGILYERVVPFSGLYNFNSNTYSNVDTSNVDHFLQGYTELYKASFQPVNSLPFDCETMQSFFEKNDIVDIGILHYKFNILDSVVAYQKLYYDMDSILHENSSIAVSLYAEKTAFLAAPLKEYVNIGTTVFRFRNLLRFDNTGNQIVGLRVNFDDNMGLQSITDTLITVTYLTLGIKTLRFEALLQNGDTLLAYSNLNCSTPSSKGNPGSQSNHPYIGPIEVITAKITPANPYESGTTFTKAKGDVCIYYADSSMQLHKPILIVDGFDPENKRTFEHHTDDGLSIWELFGNGLPDGQNLGKQLLDSGYDLVILDPQEGGIYIEQNAMVCIEVINEINRRLAQNGSQEEIIVVGPSMGGQITRYALAYMEKDSTNPNTNFGKHNCRLWISFDSPHQGANISLGAQALMWKFADLGVGKAKDTWEKTICSKAAKQMLIHHKANDGNPTSLFTKYYDALKTLGHPKNLRKVAVANGSLSQSPNGVERGLAFSGAIAIPPFFVVSADLVYAPKSGYSTKVCVITYQVLFVAVPTHWTWENNTGKCSPDAAPGGYYDTFDKVASSFWFVSFNQKNHCFMPIPTVLDISGDPDYCMSIPNSPTNNLVTQGKIPFSAYWGSEDTNMDHVEFSDTLVKWLFNEIETYTTGPRTISICEDASVPYTLHLPAGKTSTVNWDCSNNLQIISGQGTSTIQVRPTGSGAAWVQPTLGSVLTHNRTLKQYTIEIESALSHTSAPDTIFQNATWTTPYTVNNLTINNGATLTIKSGAYCNPSTVITIAPGGKLVIDGGTLTSACEGTMWQGITVSGTGGNAGKVVIYFYNFAT